MKTLHNLIFLLVLTLSLIHNTLNYVSVGNSVMNQIEQDPNTEFEINSLINEEQKYHGRHLDEEPIHESEPDNIEDQGLTAENSHNLTDPENQGEDEAGIEEFMSDPEMEEEEQEAGEPVEHAELEEFMINLNYQSEMDKLKNFRQISKDMKIFENNYRTCLEKIPSLSWDEEEITKCVGPDFTEIVNDISKTSNYKIMKRQRSKTELL